MKWIVKCLRNYANFSGRASRSEFWWFMLFCIFVGILGTGFDSLLQGGITIPVSYGDLPIHSGIYVGGWFCWVFSLALLLPGLAVSVRRLHDTGRSGWLLPVYWIGYLLVTGTMYLFLSNLDTVFASTSSGLVWLIGVAYLYGMMFRLLAFMFVYLIWLCFPSDRGPNRYGAAPAAAD